jgi:hypothetical protein
LPLPKKRPHAILGKLNYPKIGIKGETMLQRRQFIQASAGVVTALGLPNSAGAAGSKIIDAQVHCYERNRPERPWVGVLVGPDEVTGDQMVAATDAVGVDGAVLVSPFTMYQYDPSYVLEVVAKHADRFCLVKPVNPNDPAVADSIADLRQRRELSASGS